MNSTNVMLIVAALIGSITFKNGIYPPDYLKEGFKSVFVVAMTFGFSASMSIIMFGAEGMLFQRELVTSVYGLWFAYCLGAATHLFRVTAYVFFAIAIFAPFLVCVLSRHCNGAKDAAIEEGRL